MLKPNPFTIYNASAGSGKTFTLVKDYLKILFQSHDILAFRHILALTFTNKAVNEMKERIIETLRQFSDSQILEHPNSMFNLMIETLETDPKTLHAKSKNILQTIVHNYAAFDISTIDKFNHKLIRTFAHDLNLPINFEVELDTQNMLSKAVDKLIDKAGTDAELTKILIDFAIEKADDDKSWDISYDFNAIAKLLVNENEIPFINTIKDKSLNDFKVLKSQLVNTVRLKETVIIEKAKRALTLMDECGLEHNDFSGKNGLVPSYFLKLTKSNFNISFDKVWMDKIESHALYPKNTEASIASIIDDIQPQLSSLFYETKQQIVQYKFLKNCLKNVTPLSVLNAISKTLQQLKEEDNLLLISEFNTIISSEIIEQPAPFIYERIGEKFKHYFIDEFQDTSVLQWENLIPLISNTISGENLKNETGTAMLVGDAKQAIYRWRGGKPEQFIDLYNNENPFFVKKKVENLPVNYRSSKTIVEFNNTFFNHISGFAFSKLEHQSMYEQSHQDSFLKDEGYVELSFLDLQDENKDQLHCEKVLETIHKAVANGFKLEDICVIARKTKEGIAVAEYLSSENIDIVSSESLMLQNSPEVRFITCVIKLATQQKNNELKIEILSYLAEHQIKLKDTHEFYSNLIQLPPNQLFDALKVHGIDFNFNIFLQLPLYEAIESIVRQFKLNKTSNAYIQFYLDAVLDYSQKYDASFTGFIESWERKKEKLSIISSQGKNAVQIMTIHKSKGLEFPVVIFPYANQDIYFDLSPKVWFPVKEENYSGFSHLLINLNKDLETHSALGAEIYNNHQAQLELDSINLLYVVLTRAVEQLYIISEYDVAKNKNEKLNRYSGLFINYLKSIAKWNDEQSLYSFGHLKKAKIKTMRSKQSIEQTQFILTTKEDHDLNIVTNSGYLWDTAQEKAIEKGNLVHHIMSYIKTTNDIELVFEQFTLSGKLNKQQAQELKPMVYEIVNHPKLKAYFNPELTIYNEKDIITKQAKILRPDRVVINSKNEAVIIDYKTGLENSKYKEQLFDYQQTLEDMNFKVIQKILIYINDQIKITQL